MIPLVMGFRMRGRSWLFAKPFSRNLQFSEPEVTAEVSTGSDAFPATPTPQSRKGDSHRRFPLLLLDSQFRRHLGLLIRRVYFLLLAPGSESARLLRAFWLVERASRNWVSKRIIKKVISWAITYVFRLYIFSKGRTTIWAHLLASEKTIATAGYSEWLIM